MQFVNFTDIASRYGAQPARCEALFALSALMEIPEQARTWCKIQRATAADHAVLCLNVLLVALFHEQRCCEQQLMHAQHAALVSSTPACSMASNAPAWQAVRAVIVIGPTPHLPVAIQTRPVFVRAVPVHTAARPVGC